MKKRSSNLNLLISALLAAYSVTSFAAAPASGAYTTDKTNQYVEDQTSQVLQSVNNVLCHVSATAASDAKVVNTGAYNALIDSNACNPNNNGGQNANSGASYNRAIVNSTQATGGPLIGDMWLKSQGGPVYAHIVGTAPASATLPYGNFRVDYCGKSTVATTSCDVMTGYLGAGSSGLTFFETNNMSWGAGATVNDTSSLALVSSSVDAGIGAMAKSAALIAGTLPVGATLPTSVAITFAFNTTYFLRSDQAGGVNPKCFDRSLANAAKTAWSYGLYDATGAHFNRNGGFPVEFTDANGLQQGWASYWGLWTTAATPPANGTTVYQVTYANGTANKAAYTLLQSGGTLHKHTKVAKTLAAMDKLRFWYWAMSNVPAAAAVPTMAAGSNYELYWDKALNQFVVAGKEDPITFNMIPYATPVAIANVDMVAANPWGLQAWSSMTGGNFAIDSAAMTALATTTSATQVVFTSDDIVYPADFATALPQGLKCIGDCPTAADITTAANTTVMPLAGWPSPFGLTAGAGWGIGIPLASLTSYTLDATTGNLIDAAPAPVIDTLGSTVNPNMMWGVHSGNMFSAADLANVDAAKTAAGVAGGTAGSYTLSDLDLPVPATGVPVTTYTWSTSPNSWDQLSVLKDATGVMVKFDAPLNVNYVVPNTAAFGVYAGSTMVLQYNGFGDLWGIPSSCVDLATNAPCNFANLAAGANPPATWTWKPDFSIQADGTANFVTATVAPATTASTFWIKPLEEEVRFANVPVATCTTAGLALPATAPGLPGIGGFNAAAINNVIPTVASTKTAPRVIQGVVQY